MTSSTNDFDIGKAVAAQLKGIEKERQQRILRWVAESLGLDFGAQERPPSEPPIGSGVPGADQMIVNLLQRPHGRVDIKTFVESKKPKSDVHFAALVAYYYRFETPLEIRKDAIDADVLQEAARLVGRRRPPRALTTLNNAKNLGYLDSTERGKFSINSVGENLVAMALPSGQQDAGRQKSRTAKRGKSKRPRR